MKGFKLLLLSILILLITFLTPLYIQLDAAYSPFTISGLSISLLISIVGLLLGLKDSEPENRTFGKMGNLLLIIFSIAMLFHHINNPNAGKQTSISQQDFNDLMIRELSKTSPTVKYSLPSDTAFSSKIYNMKYWLEQDDRLAAIAEYNGLQYEKMFNYDIGEIDYLREFESINDMGKLSFEFDDRNTEGTKSVDVMVKAIFKKDSVQFDTTYKSTFTYYLKEDSIGYKKGYL